MICGQNSGRRQSPLPDSLGKIREGQLPSLPPPPPLGTLVIGNVIVNETIHVIAIMLVLEA